MNKFKFVPQDGFRDASAFPNPTSEAETRSQMQSIPDQLKDYINNEILDDNGNIDVSNIPVATSTTPGLMPPTDKVKVDGLESALATKVDKVAGKGLSTNDFTDEYKAKVDSPNPSTMPYYNSAMEATNVKMALDELCDDVNLIEEDLPDYIYDVKVNGTALAKTVDERLHSSVDLGTALSKKLDATDWECGIRYSPGGVYMGNVLDDSVVSPMINIDSNNIFISGEDQTTGQSWEMVTGIRVDGEGEKIELDAPNGVKINGAVIDPTAKQDKLVSGTNIKTFNGQSILGSGDVTTKGFGRVVVTDVYAGNSFSLNASGDNSIIGVTFAENLHVTQGTGDAPNMTVSASLTFMTTEQILEEKRQQGQIIVLQYPTINFAVGQTRATTEINIAESGYKPIGVAGIFPNGGTVGGYKLDATAQKLSVTISASGGSTVEVGYSIMYVKE